MKNMERLIRRGGFVSHVRLSGGEIHVRTPGGNLMHPVRDYTEDQQVEIFESRAVEMMVDRDLQSATGIIRNIIQKG